MRRHYVPPPPPTQLRTSLTWRAWLFPPSHRTWPWWASEEWDEHVGHLRTLPVMRQHGLTVTWRDYLHVYACIAHDVIRAAIVCLLLVLAGCALVWSLQ